MVSKKKPTKKKKKTATKKAAKKAVKKAAKKAPAKKTATPKKATATSRAELPTHKELLSFLDARTDDERFLTFVARCGIEAKKLIKKDGFQRFVDDKRGIELLSTQGWIHHVEVFVAYAGALEHGLAMGQTRAAVKALLGKSKHSDDWSEEFDRDLWRWTVGFDPAAVCSVAVAPLDIETGKREPGESPRR